MTVTVLASESAPTAAGADALVIGIFAGADGPVPSPDLGEAGLTAALTALGATGKPEEITKIPTACLSGAVQVPVIVAVGLGAPESGPRGQAAGDGSDAGQRRAYLERLRRAAGAAARELSTGGSGPAAAGGTASRVAPPRQQSAGGSGPAAAGGPVGTADQVGTASTAGEARHVALALPAGQPDEAEAVALGALLGGYAFRRYRTTGNTPADVTYIVHTAHCTAVGRARSLAEAITLVRDLVNTSPSDMVPADLATVAEQVAAAHGLGIQVLDENNLAKDGYGGILAVGMGSAHPPRLVRLEYTHPAAAGTVVFAGKGITFDSGGLSLKPSKAMETMKADMGGAAAVLGALQAIAVLGPAVNVIGYLPLAENMPGGGAQRPSDVITSYGGKTVEVLNTDAEGRLILADALARSAADAPSLLVDVATLTGAQSVALGTRTAGVMASDDSLAAQVVDAAGRAGEAMWPMPLPEDLRKGLESAVADIANVAPDRSGGMLVAGLFLREFVPAGVRWAHLDIAGPGYNDGPAYGYITKGGTGAAVRTLVQLAEDVADGRLGVPSG
ncbi:MAG: leucyl aminopeptidase [Streptosporangiaceae bacterium]|nr:leucyl aminopeptidase [Streptosporangiaceae bacterium]